MPAERVRQLEDKLEIAKELLKQSNMFIRGMAYAGRRDARLQLEANEGFIEGIEISWDDSNESQAVR